jgi:hypothetical protein
MFTNFANSVGVNPRPVRNFRMRRPSCCFVSLFPIVGAIVSRGKVYSKRVRQKSGGSKRRNQCIDGVSKVSHGIIKNVSASWVCTPEFLARLRHELQSYKSATTMAKLVLDKTGVKIASASLRKLKMGLDPTSSLIGPICLAMGWRLPPMAFVHPLVGQAASDLYQLLHIDPVTARATVEAVEKQLDVIKVLKGRKIDH